MNDFLRLGRGEVGRVGEEIASIFLENKGFFIVGRNYRKKWGEIDIIAKKGNSMRFVEVKTISSSGDTSYMPEENVHYNKLKRLTRTIETFCAERSFYGDWQIDVIAVFLDVNKKEAKVRFTENAAAG
ncbi:MAG: YraN family protein [Patescibacteria group bacterium]